MTVDTIVKAFRGGLKGVTPGPWNAHKGIVDSDEMRCGVTVARGKTEYLLVTIENGAPGDFCETEEANARHLARCSPENIAALLDRIEALEKALEPSAETKAAYIGEFSFSQTYVDDAGNEMTETIMVPWTTIKDIMKAIRARAARSQQ